MFVNLFCGVCSKVFGGEEERAASSTPSRNVAQAAASPVPQAGAVTALRAGDRPSPQVARTQQALSTGPRRANSTQQLLAEAQALMKQLQRDLDLARRAG